MYAGKTMKVKPNVPGIGGEEIVIEDFWEKVYGKKWADSDGNFAALNYAYRAGITGIIPDDDVYYGKIGGLGHLVHSTELEGA